MIGSKISKKSERNNKKSFRIIIDKQNDSSESVIKFFWWYMDESNAVVGHPVTKRSNIICSMHVECGKPYP